MKSVVCSSRKTAFVEGRNGQFGVGLNCKTRQLDAMRNSVFKNVGERNYEFGRFLMCPTLKNTEVQKKLLTQVCYNEGKFFL